MTGARIWRDEYGRPAIFGDDLKSALRAVGYESEDGMWQQHLFRMAARDPVSELIGDDGLDMAITTRRDNYIAAMHADPSKMPAEIRDLRDYLQGDTPAKAVMETLTVTLDGLAQENAGAATSQWTRDSDTLSLEVQGLGPGGKFAYQDRGSWIEVVEYQPR